MTLPMDDDTELLLDTINIRAAQADRMSVVRFALRLEVSVLNKKLFSMNLFRLVYFESNQCGSLAAIR
jgi:hypothetical protein